MSSVDDTFELNLVPSDSILLIVISYSLTETSPNKYKLTDLGPTNWLLGIKINCDLANKTVSLSQRAYIEAIITRFNFDDLKPSAIPIDPSTPLLRSQSPTKLEDIAKMKNVPYRESMGSLMYAAMGTRPDIAFATSTVAQFSENLGWPHWEAVQNFFCYLLGMKDLELTYGGEETYCFSSIIRVNSSHILLADRTRLRADAIV